MAITVKQLGPGFFAELRGVDISKDLPQSDIEAIHDALMEHGVLCLPGQEVTDDQQKAFCARFGPLEPNLRDPTENVAPLGNVDRDGNMRDPEGEQARFLRANQQWHSDSTYFASPAAISFLSGRIVAPKGGETQFGDFRAAYDALPEARKAFLDKMVCVHDIQNSRRRAGRELDETERLAWPPVHHAVIRRHEVTGRKALYLGSQAGCFLGMSVEDSRKLIDELIAYATQDRFVYTHRWTQYDMLIWDDRRVVHRGRPWDEKNHKRDIRRSTLAGSGPTAMYGQPIDEYARAHPEAA